MTARNRFWAMVRAALRTPCCYPLTGDGPLTRRVIAEYRQHGTASDDEVRIALCEARYRDWQRDRFTVIEGGKE